MQILYSNRKANTLSVKRKLHNRQTHRYASYALYYYWHTKAFQKKIIASHPSTNCDSFAIPPYQSHKLTRKDYSRFLNAIDRSLTRFLFFPFKKKEKNCLRKIKQTSKFYLLYIYRRNFRLKIFLLSSPARKKKISISRLLNALLKYLFLDKLILSYSKLLLFISIDVNKFKYPIELIKIVATNN